MPSLAYTVEAKFSGESTRSTAANPFTSVAPTTCPPGVRPPANSTLIAFDQWSRPASLLICGVRPNSPKASTSVLSSSPRWCRSSTSADTLLSQFGSRVLSDSNSFV